MAMRRIFWDFCINWILIYPLHYISTPQLAESESRLIPLFGESKSRRLPDSPSQRVGGSLSRRVGVVSRGVAIQNFFIYCRFSELITGGGRRFVC
jgi:hypothetical protein